MTQLQQQRFLTQLDFKLPHAYAAYLFSNPEIYQCYGACLVEANQLLQYNTDYGTTELFPGYFLIGSTGGGEAFAIEKTTGYFVMTPFVGHDEETPIVIGRTWPEFFQRFQTGNLFDVT